MLKQGTASQDTEDGSTIFLRLNNYTGVAVKSPGSLILIDPDNYGPGHVSGHGLPGGGHPDAILVSHSHPKHFTPADVASLADADTKVMGTWRVIYSLKKMARRRPRNMIALRPGNSIFVGDVEVEVHRALHPYKAVVPTVSERFASVDEGKWGEQHLSFAFTPKGFGKVYHMSDSVPFKGLEEIKGVEIAILPVNLGHWNSIEDAVLAVKALRPRIVLALGNFKKGGLLDRWSARREQGRFRKKISSLGAEVVFLGDKPYAYTR